MDNTTSELVGRFMHYTGFEVSDLPDNNCLGRICVEASSTVKPHTFDSESKPCMIYCLPLTRGSTGNLLAVFSVLNLRSYQLQIAFQVVFRVD
jgi:hypothetical protein